MKTLAIIAAVFICVAFPCQARAAAASFGGPFQYKNQFPLFTGLGKPYAESARPEDSAAATLSYSSVYLVRNSPEWSAGLDMEIVELDLSFKKTLFKRIEAGLHAPFISFNSGVLDGPLSEYHSAFGFGDYGRSERPKNAFLYKVDRHGSPFIRGESGRVRPGDVRLSAKALLLSMDPLVSVKADMELPTGDARAGYGNGNVDAGASLIVDKEIGERAKVYLNAGRVFPGDARGYQRVALRDYNFASVAVEAAAFWGINLLAQLSYEESPYPRTGIDVIDRPAETLTVGGRYFGSYGNYELALTEDLNTSGACDFSVVFSLKIGF